ncbi:hypothetical protein [Tessaracoccus sp. Z1128]
MRGFRFDSHSGRVTGGRGRSRVWVAVLMAVALAVQVLALPGRAVAAGEPEAYVNLSATGTGSCPAVLERINFYDPAGVFRERLDVTLPMTIVVQPDTYFYYRPKQPINCLGVEYESLVLGGGFYTPAEGGSRDLVVGYRVKPTITASPAGATYSISATSVVVSHANFTQTPTLTTTIPGAVVSPCSASSCSFFIPFLTAAGSYSITATEPGGSSRTVPFVIGKAASTVTLTCNDAVYSGTARTPCRATAAGLTDWVLPTITYTDNVNAGTATAEATWAGDANHTGSTVRKTFTIDKATSRIGMSCYGSVGYTGDPVSGCFDAYALGVGGLREPVQIVFENNIDAGINTASATATWDGGRNHTGSTGTQTFSINRAGSTVTIVCPTSVGYTGSPLEPCSAQAEGVGMTEELTVTYTGNVQLGTARATAQYDGDRNHYPSSASSNFTVVPGSTAVSILCPTVDPTYTGSPIEPCTGTVTAAGMEPANVALTYRDNVDAGTATVSGSWPGDANHTASSSSVEFTIAPAPVTMTAGSYSGQFDGVAHDVGDCAVTGAFTGSLACVNNPATVGVSAGNGVVTPQMRYGTEDPANFEVATVQGQWTVTPADLVVFVGAAPAIAWSGDGNYTGPVTMKVGSRSPSDLANDADLRVELTGLVTRATETLDCQRRSDGGSAAYVCSNPDVDLPHDVYSAVATTEGLGGDFAGAGYAGLAIYDPTAKGSAEGSAAFTWADGSPGNVTFGAKLNKKGTTVQGGLMLVRTWEDSAGSHTAVLKGNALGGLTFSTRRVSGESCAMAAFNGKSSYTLDGETVGNQQFALVAVDCEADADDQVIVTGPGVFAASSPVSLDLDAGSTVLVNP